MPARTIVLRLVIQGCGLEGCGLSFEVNTYTFGPPQHLRAALQRHYRDRESRAVFGPLGLAVLAAGLLSSGIAALMLRRHRSEL